MIATVRTQVKLDGMDGVLKTLGRMKGRAQQRIIRDSLRKAYQPVAREAKAIVARETTTLKRSIGIREGSKLTKTYAVVGPRRRMGRMIAVGRGGRLRLATKRERASGGNYEYRNPTQYGHLVEFGHRIVRNGVEIGKVPPQPFMGAAFDKPKQMRALEVFKRQLQSRVMAAAARQFGGA